MNLRRARPVFTALPAFCFSRAGLGQVVDLTVNKFKYRCSARRQGLTVIFTRMPNRVANFALNPRFHFEQIRTAIGRSSRKTLLSDPDVVNRDFSRAGDRCIARQRFAFGRCETGHIDKEHALCHFKTCISITDMSSWARNSLDEGINAKLKAATASAIALSQTRLAPGQSTDGSICLRRGLGNSPAGTLCFAPMARRSNSIRIKNPGAWPLLSLPCQDKTFG